MNVDESQQSFIDSNIWLYRFIINPREILPVSLETLQTAVKLRAQYLLSFWDSLIVASAVLGGASILYSEDMQDGLILENTLQILNPYRVNSNDLS